MKKILIIIFLGYISLIVYGQEEIELVPYDKQEKTEIYKFNSSPDNDNIRDIIYSKNDLNIISIEINPPDINKAQKSQLNIINLYDSKGNLLAKSEPVDLYDWVVKPLGDNNTVLMIFPAGTARKAIIRIYKKSGNALVETNAIKRETTYFSIDISMDGKYFICGFSAFDGISNLPEIMLFNDSGKLLWSNSIDESRFYQVAISKKHVFGASVDIENERGFMYLFDYHGERLMKDTIYSHIGNYKIKFSDFENDKYFAISSLKNIYLFDSDKKIKIKDFICDSGMEISDYIIDEDGTIISTVMIREYSKEKREFVISDQELVIEDLLNQKKSINFQSDREPLLIKDQNRIIIKLSTNQKESYHEIQY